MAYAGHQFGNWAGQLGDGRAIALGELIGTDGNRHTLQLKGAGPTPYSRSADGRAVLRSSIREFLCSEAMHHLGVPTTRALSLCTTGDDDAARHVLRRQRRAYEPGAVVVPGGPVVHPLRQLRDPSRRREGDDRAARRSLDFTDHAPLPRPRSAAEARSATTSATSRCCDEVVATTVEMVVHWQRVGFVHGVMNTDNMSIHGLTIDYGPYGWLEDYDPDWTPNTTDAGAQALPLRLPAAPSPSGTCSGSPTRSGPGGGRAIDPLQEAMDTFSAAVRGPVARSPGGGQAAACPRWSLRRRPMSTRTPAVRRAPAIHRDRHDAVLVPGARRGAGDVAAAVTSDDRLLAPLLGRPTTTPDRAGHRATVRWLAGGGLAATYGERPRAAAQASRTRTAAAMNRVNPKYVLRNYLAQTGDRRSPQAGDASERGHDPAGRPAQPHTRISRSKDRFAEKRPDWARTRPGCSMLSCSS